MSVCMSEVTSKRNVQDSSNSHLLIRPMRKSDLPEVMKLRQEVHIHDTPQCIETWLTLDPQGIKVVENEAGEIVGTCSAVKQTDDLYFVGLYYIREEYRGCGIGIQIWKACMERVTNAALNSLPSKVDLFRTRAGFTNPETEYMLNRNLATEPVDPNNLSSHLPQGLTIEPFTKSLLPLVCAYDSALVGYERRRFLELSFHERNTKTFVAIRNGTCVGFGSIKKSCLGAGRVSPLFADDSAGAEGLLRNLIVSLPNVEGFAMLSASTNVSACRLMKKLKVPLAQQVTRMYKGKKLSIDADKLYGVSDACFAMF